MVIFQSILALNFRRSLCEHRQLSLVIHKVLHHRESRKRSAKEVIVFVHLCDNSSLIYKLDVACLKARLKHIVANHVELQTTRLPETVHNLKELQHKVILLKVVSALEQKLDHLGFFLRLLWLILFCFSGSRGPVVIA